MILITVELLAASSGERSLLGRAVIINDGTGTSTYGNYDMLIQRGRKRGSIPEQVRRLFGEEPWWHNPDRVARRVRIERFPRNRLGGWDLLLRGLRTAYGNRNGF